MKTKQIGEEKPNNSWEIEKLNLVKEISKAMSYDYSVYDAMSNNDTPEEVAVNLLDDFITKTIQQQREDYEFTRKEIIEWLHEQNWKCEQLEKLLIQPKK